MPSAAASEKGSESGPPQGSFCFRCIGCGSVTHLAAQDFRCAQGGNLLEITDPAWNSLDAATLKSFWRDRPASNPMLDRSAVSRIRGHPPPPTAQPPTPPPPP